MCGLIATWDPSGLADAPLALALADIRHRGPDAQASLWREHHRLHLAHARLKIIDTTDGANQPYVSPCGRWALVYNGEIYNFRELRQEMADRWPWRTQSDTEVLMAAWSLWGEGCLSRFVGMFAFAIHDAEEHALTLVRDRFGIKPLYHVAIGARRVFASEIPPLLRFRPAVADESTIRTYLELGLYDHGTRTFFKDVRSLEPGTLTRIDLRSGGEATRRWYSLAEHVPDLSGVSEEELTDRAETLVLQAVSSHLVADVEVGLNVSGGVDSSMLVRSTVETLGHAHLFTQDYDGYSELPWVREIAGGGSLHVASLDLDAISTYLEETVRSQAEPFGGVFVCGYNALYEAAARENVTVLLDGNGVDEAFLGYKRYHQIHVASSPDAAIRDVREREFAEFWGQAPAPIVAGASIDGTDGLRPQAVSSSLKSAGLLDLTGRDGGFDDSVRQAAAQDLLYAKIPRGLRFNDRVSMAHSRELRVPYLDHRLVEFAFGIPTRVLLNRKGGKALFRDILARRAPASVSYARKRSVQTPQREWLAEGWRAMVESILASERFAARGWVDAGQARRAYAEYLSGARENSFFVWQWVNLELWAREYLDREACR
ncbi:asparagine synthase (glutamine-hydrolyzing) [Synechococcus sp. HJ21-Hayes]|uniref:asparagine synthase (glutamine-hydrolyzing) n=1 Tax=unclassified Synechococcus TaxID=2626047 RepID=UPI0020CC953C|nr:MULTISPECIES: asparagine synthase (glutamine-hydrolyzing) [unclassified Synechococcus]MCP9830079.1 asparagine synthase (glutamine-hydrolyzing) [Synechococcus sp. JJ3a-Johnson]MCP9852113.1 asparagine synthase (glutamine-hydrolyzing) [Synechococcus sp. HJ21-Hayes]